MSEINAACDAWIAEIRARPHAATPSSGRPSAAAAPAASTPPDIEAPIELPLRYAAATVALVAVIIAVVIVLVGVSATSLADGALVGAGAAGLFVTLLYQWTRREAQRR